MELVGEWTEGFSCFQRKVGDGDIWLFQRDSIFGRRGSLGRRRVGSRWRGKKIGCLRWGVVEGTGLVPGVSWNGSPWEMWFGKDVE